MRFNVWFSVSRLLLLLLLYLDLFCAVMFCFRSLFFVSNTNQISSWLIKSILSFQKLKILMKNSTHFFLRFSLKLQQRKNERASKRESELEWYIDPGYLYLYLRIHIYASLFEYNIESFTSDTHTENMLLIFVGSCGIFDSESWKMLHNNILLSILFSRICCEFWVFAVFIEIFPVEIMGGAFIVK